MTEVLLVAGRKPNGALLAQHLREFRARGVQVHLAGMFDIAEIKGDLELDGFHRIRRSADSYRRGFRRRAQKVPAGERVWMYAQRHPEVRKLGRRAPVLVALDDNAVYTVWRMAHRNPRADARYGLVPGLNALEALNTTPRSRRDMRSSLAFIATVNHDLRRRVRALPSYVMLAVTARPVMRSRSGALLWRVIVVAPAVPDRLRATLARTAADGMTWAGRPNGATLVLSIAASKAADPSVKADLLYSAANLELGRAKTSQLLEHAVTAQLRLADRCYGADRKKAAAKALDRAMGVAFHRVLHIDRLTSPLADDHGAYLAPFQESAAAGAVTVPRGRKVLAGPPAIGRPHRLLIATSVNDNFLPLIRSHYTAHPGVEMRFLDAAADPQIKALTSATQILEHKLSGRSNHGNLAERLLRPHLDWADTVFIDWCASSAALFTSVDPGTTKIIIRLHSYEAFARWPHLVDFSRVDALVFVAAHIRDQATAVIDQLRGGAAPPTHIIGNAMNLRAFQREKSSDARFTLGVVGVGQVVKDPRWALRVLSRLRERDRRYRLILVGGAINPKTSAASRDYLVDFERELAPLERSGAAVLVGPTDNVPGALSDIGVILSTSVREGCHVGLMEGAASGAVPVVRDWPFFAGRPNSARTLYPEGWVVTSPDEATERILSVTATEETWRAAGQAAADHALTTWDWSVVRHDFDQLLLGEDGSP